MEGSVVRMGGLIDNVLDFARTRMGAGLVVKEAEPKPMEPVLEQVVSEFRSIHPDRTIETEFDVATPVVADHLRLAQAVLEPDRQRSQSRRGRRAGEVGATTTDDELVFWVANSGKPIPPK